MVELQLCEHVETMYPKTQKFNNIFEEVNGRIAIFQKNSVGKNIQKMCTNFDWHIMMESYWNRLPTWAALAWNLQKLKNSIIISDGENGRKQNFLRKLAKGCYKEAV